MTKPKNILLFPSKVVSKFVLAFNYDIRDISRVTKQITRGRCLVIVEAYTNCAVLIVLSRDGSRIDLADTKMKKKMDEAMNQQNYF